MSDNNIILVGLVLFGICLALFIIHKDAVEDELDRCVTLAAGDVSRTLVCTARYEVSMRLWRGVR